MKLIKPSFSILNDTNYNIESIYKRIELVGRCSHKSEDKITETSAKDFVGRMLNMKHLATCEFGTVYLHAHSMYDLDIEKYRQNPYSKAVWKNNGHYITTNYRVLVENNWLDDLKYLCEPTEYHHKRYTVKFICDRGILAEFTRHRRFSFMAESTRYCNYSKGKFNNELTFIIPCWLKWDEQIIHQGDFEKSGSGSEDSGLYINSLLNSEKCYKYLIKEGWKAEEARNILPLSLKTELYMCGFAEDWEQFFKLRTASNVHPQAKELAIPLKEEFIKRGYINE